MVEQQSKIISINVDADIYNWLEKHKNINRSKLFRESVERIKNNSATQQKVSPLMFLISIMGIVFSIALIGIAATPTPINVYARGLLALLGGVMAISTSILYYKEHKAVKGE